MSHDLEQQQFDALNPQGSLPPSSPIPGSRSPAPPPAAPLSPDYFWLHIDRSPLLFRAVRLFGLTTAPLLHSATVVVGGLALYAIFLPLEGINLALIGVVVFVLSGLYHLGLKHQSGFLSPGHFIYECYRLSVRHGISLAAAFFVAVAVARTARPDWQVLVAWLVCFVLVSQLLSGAFNIFLSQRVHRPSRLPVFRDPLAVDPGRLRRPPDITR